MSSREASAQAVSPRLDSSPCEREQIHIPGAIQPHGALLAALADRWLVTHASANLSSILGHSAGAVLGRLLQETVGEAACRVLQGAGPRDEASLGQAYSVPGPDGGVLHLHAHRSGRHILVDIEPAHPEPRPPVTMVQSVVQTFKQATSRSELCELAVRGLRAITGYDRVMAYRFGEDGHGEVVAEARAAELEPFLGLNYPATDIPPQARRQYLRQRVNVIVDSDYLPVPLLVDPVLDDGTPLDLTHSVLRSVSPIHRAYMRNMKTAASLTVGLVHGQQLWGMLVCHHATARVAGPELRAVADLIGQVVSLLLVSLGDVEVYCRRLERTATLHALVDRLTVPVPLPEALAAAEAELLHLVDATGAMVRISGTVVCLGRTPPPETAERALLILQAGSLGEVLAVEDLGLRHPELAGCTSEASGALLLPLAQGTDDAILWFRPELSRSIAWGGNPAEHATADPVTGRLSPRASFAAWRETVSGHCAPWAEADLWLARELRGAIEAEVAQRAKADLSWLHHYQELSDSLERKVEQRTRDLEAETIERRKAEATLQQAQKMEAIGQLTGGVAHDFNNVLAAMFGNLELARARTADPVLDRFLQNAQHAAERGAKLTDHLLSFARKQPLRREACDLNQLITRFKSLIARTIGPIIDVRLALADDLWTVMADANQFEMALLNLAVNARDAMPDGGTLVIATINLSEGSRELPSDLDPGDYACVCVSDSGTGMSAKVAARVFEPFYTTKQVGQGTGLGLSQVYGFSKQLGGSATLSSEVGAGTRVWLLLPRARQAGMPAPSASVMPVEPQAIMQPNGARVLVIDDEPDVRDAAVEALRALGYDVVAAAESARLGLEMLEATPIDLVMTDFSMPEMDGVEFIRRARLLRPRLPCLLVTGYADTSSLGDVLSGGTMILRKPYRMKELAAIVNRVLAQAGHPGDEDAYRPPAALIH